MLQKDNRTKILELFFKDPLTKFQLREISREVKVAPPSVKNYLKQLEKENLITKHKHRLHNYPLYQANRDNDFFKLLKKQNLITTLKEIKLIDFLKDQCLPDTIILFGSASKGEDIQQSDIDLFLISKEKKMNLKDFQKKLNRKINIFFSDNFNKLSKELKNNIINGVILDGYLKVF